MRAKINSCKKYLNAHKYLVFFTLVAISLTFAFIQYHIEKNYMLKTGKVFSTSSKEENSIVLDFGDVVRLVEVKIFLNGKGNRMIAVSVPEDGEWKIISDNVQLKESYTWNSVKIGYELKHLGIVFLDEEADVSELICLDEKGNLIEPVNASLYAELFDEQRLYDASSVDSGNLKKFRIVILFVSVFVFVLFLLNLIHDFIMAEMQQPVTGKKEEFQKQQRIIMGMLIFYALLRLIYICSTNYLNMQNDVGRLDDSRYGHLGYIYYLANGGSIIYNQPDYYIQFYHPPLHHMVSAVWLKIQLFLGCSLDVAGGRLAVLPWVYSVLSLIAGDCMVIKCRGSFGARIVSMCLLGSFPYFIMLSGALNNDGLMYLLFIIAMYYIISYVQEGTQQNVVKAALALGMASMTKQSAMMLFVPIEILALFLFFKEKEKRFTYIKDGIAFLAISIPIAIWYPIKNCFLYRMPFFYILYQGDNSPQYIGNFAVWQRFFDFSRKQLQTLGIAFGYRGETPEHNIFLALLKYGLFGESDYYRKYAWSEAVCRVLFYILAVLFMIFFIQAIMFTIKGKTEGWCRLFLSAVAVCVMISYVRFCFTHPHVCTMNIRYILPAVFCMGLQCGLAIDSIRKIWVKRGIVLCVGSYVVCTLVLITLLLCP